MVLVDEADHLFLDKYCKVSGEGAIVGLTATSYDVMRESEQSHMLNTLEFQFVASGMTVNADEKKVIDTNSLDEFFDATPTMAHIIYCDETDKAEVLKAATAHFKGLSISPAIHLNACSQDVLQNNDERSLYIITDERLMRGFDYRAPITGIALLVAKPLSSLRSYRQALGRVGRMGDVGFWAKTGVAKGYLDVDQAHFKKLLGCVKHEQPQSKQNKVK